MSFSELIKAFGGGTSAASIAVLILAIMALFGALLASLKARIARAEERSDALNVELTASKDKHLATAIDVAALTTGILRLHNELEERLEKNEEERKQLAILRADLVKERDEMKRQRPRPRAKVEGSGP